MILCRECGNSAPSRDGFCSSCGALLDWSGERVETKVLPTVQAASAGPAGSLESQGAVASGWIPAAEARRADPVPVASEPEYSGPYCQSCGVRNPEDRQFCRACGAMLQLPAFAPQARRGWWRRLIDRLTGRRRQYSAGERPSGFRDHHGASSGHHKRGLRLPRHIKLGKLAPLLIIAGLAGIGLGPARTWATNEFNTLLGKAKAKVNQHYANVTPVGAAGASEKDHAAALAIDGLNTTYWATSQHPDGVGEAVTITFSAPVDIDQIGILSGADAQNFRAFARPRDLVVTAAGAQPVTLSFDDSADFQNRAATLRHVTSVTITVKDAYPGQKEHDLAVRDLEFFVKSS